MQVHADLARLARIEAPREVRLAADRLHPDFDEPAGHPRHDETVGGVRSVHVDHTREIQVERRRRQPEMLAPKPERRDECRLRPGILHRHRVDRTVDHGIGEPRGEVVRDRIPHRAFEPAQEPAIHLETVVRETRNADVAVELHEVRRGEAGGGEKRTVEGDERLVAVARNRHPRR